MNKLFFIFTALTISLVAQAEVFQGKIKDAVGSAHHLNGAPCVLKVLSKEDQSLYAIIEVSPVTSPQKTLKLPAVLSKSGLYLVEKALGYDYASHKTTQDKFSQTEISNLLKIDESRAALTQEYNQSDVSLLYGDSKYYRFTCTGHLVN